MPLWLEWSVKNKKDWEKLKNERFNLNSITNSFIVDKNDFLKESKKITASFGI